MAAYTSIDPEDRSINTISSLNDEEGSIEDGDCGLQNGVRRLSLSSSSVASGVAECTINGEREFKVYTRRWFIMVVVVLLNISNAALWITYAPVASYVAAFYGRSGGEVNYFSIAYLLVSIPFCFISTFAVNRVGLGVAIHAGAGLNCAGSIIKAIGTSTFISSQDAQFGISLTGQVISAMAQSFLLFIPTKVSQIWFPNNQRTIATTILSMSNPLGIVVAQVISPVLVTAAEDVTLNNYVWMGLAVVGQLLTLVVVTRSKPPTPASLSSEKGEQQRAPYLQQLKATLTCIPYLLLLAAIGFGIAYLSAMATVTQQLLCGLGYTTSFSGLATGMLIMVGFVGSAIFGIYVDKTKLFTPVCKVCYACAAIMGICMMEFYLQPNQQAAILVFSGLFGFFGVGGYPIGLELAVEATYPVEETISTAFIFLSGQLQGVLLIALITWLSTEQLAEYEHLELCSVDGGEVVPKDYSMSLVAMMCILTILISLLIVFFNTPYKRMEADRKNKLPASLAAPSAGGPGRSQTQDSILPQECVKAGNTTSQRASVLAENNANKNEDEKSETTADSSELDTRRSIDGDSLNGSNVLFTTSH